MSELKEDKDLREVWDAVEALVKAALGPNKLADATAALPKLVAAADGVQNAVASVQDAEAWESVGAFAGRLAKTVKEAVSKPDEPEAA